MHSYKRGSSARQPVQKREVVITYTALIISRAFPCVDLKLVNALRSLL